jgi:hypothetical protein
MELIETNHSIKQKYEYILIGEEKISEAKHRTNSKKLKIQLVGIVAIIALYVLIFIAICMKEYTRQY